MLLQQLLKLFVSQEPPVDDVEEPEELLEEGETQVGEFTKQLPIPLIGQHIA